MSFKSLNVHCPPLGIKREHYDSPVSIKMESLESPKHSAMQHMSTTSPNDMLKCKKRVNYTKMSYSTAHLPQPSVARRNERERNRVKMVNMGFATLRQHVPNGAKNKKMSKVETLRSAVEYIRQLQKLLGNQSNENNFSHEQYDNSMSAAGTSGDENCYPSPVSGSHMVPSHMEPVSMEHMSYSNQLTYTSIGNAMYSPASSEMSGKLTTYSLTSPAMASRTSPSPSVGSDITTSSSSPYDSHSLLDATGARQTAIVGSEEELFDFTNWF